MIGRIFLIVFWEKVIRLYDVTRQKVFCRVKSYRFKSSFKGRNGNRRNHLWIFTIGHFTLVTNPAVNMNEFSDEGWNVAFENPRVASDDILWQNVRLEYLIDDYFFDEGETRKKENLN